MKTLYIIRGLPGSGKSTLAKRLAQFPISADDYFTKFYGEGFFKPELLKEAREWCLLCVKEDMKNEGIVAVANTFTQMWEMQPYLDAAKEMGIPLSSSPVRTTLGRCTMFRLLLWTR